MKTKLLRRLRRRARSQVMITSVTTTGDTVTGMSYRYSNGIFTHVWGLGMTEEQFMRKIEHIYMRDYIEKDMLTIERDQRVDSIIAVILLFTLILFIISNITG